jgi:hypothetical protein
MVTTTLRKRNSVLVITALLFFYMQFHLNPITAQGQADILIEPVFRRVLLSRLSDDYKTRTIQGVKIRYTDEDADNLSQIIETVRCSYDFNRRLFNYDSGLPAEVVVFPDSSALDLALTGAANGSTSGFYWAGVLGVVSPREWDVPVGPIYHEMAHLILEKKTRGNLPVWLSEGLAQYSEYVATDTYWLGEFDSKEPDYSYNSVNAGFSELPDQYSAYRQAFFMTKMMIQDVGESGIKAVLDGLAGGMDFDTVFKKEFGVSPQGYFDGRESMRKKDIVKAS